MINSTINVNIMSSMNGNKIFCSVGNISIVSMKVLTINMYCICSISMSITVCRIPTANSISGMKF